MTAPSLLALTTLDGQSPRYLDKAASLALAMNARLRLAYCGDGSGLFDAPLARLAQRTRRLARLFGVPVEMVEEDIRSNDVLRRHVAQSTLTCLSRAALTPVHARRTRDLLGRLLDLRSAPVLVVRPDTQAPYRKVLVPVSLSADSVSLVQWAMALGSEATIDIFHAADHGFMSVDARFEACRRMGELTRGLHSPDRPFRYTVAHGPVQVAIAQEQRGRQQDLVVVGDRPRSPWWRLCRPPLAWTLPAALPVDVLVVPRPRVDGALRWASPWRTAT